MTTGLGSGKRTLPHLGRPFSAAVTSQQVIIQGDFWRVALLTTLPVSLRYQ
jgi:hypothetical protein